MAILVQRHRSHRNRVPAGRPAAESPDEKLDAVQPLIDCLLDDGNSDLITSGIGTDLFFSSELDRSIAFRLQDLSVRI